MRHFEICQFIFSCIGAAVFTYLRYLITRVKFNGSASRKTCLNPHESDADLQKYTTNFQDVLLEAWILYL